MHTIFWKDVHMEDMIDFIFQRRSIRRYTGEKVEDAHIKLLLKAAMAAPSACNRQPWEFIVITDQEILKNIQDRLHTKDCNAPMAIIVCGDMKFALSGYGKEYWIQDCSAATENILIGASALGLGTIWVGAYPVVPIVQVLAEMLLLPPEVIPLNIIYIGHPAEEKEPGTQYNENKIHWQQYHTKKYLF